MTVFVADDDIDLLKEYETAIRAEFSAAKVKTFIGIKNLAEQAKAEHPNLVILDADLRNSMATARELRKLDAKIVFLSKDSERASTAIRISNAGYFLKPVGAAELCDRIRPLCQA